MKKIILIIALVCLSLNPTFINAQEKSVAKNVAIEGVGIDGVSVGATNRDSIIEKYGKDYELIVYGAYSEQMKYSKLGMSFIIVSQINNRLFFAIEFRSPAEVTTGKGIVLGKSTIKDAIRLYGEPNKEFDVWLKYKGVDFRNVDLQTNKINLLTEDSVINEIYIYSFDFEGCG